MSEEEKDPLLTKSSLDLSIVVPAYREAERIIPTLESMLAYLRKREKEFEILVVDDGSTDQTADVVKLFRNTAPEVQLLRYEKNRGKGYAVRYGMLHTKGKRVLFADADGSTPIEEISKLDAEMDEGADVAIGSRALASSETRVEALWYRKFMGRVFNFFANTLLVPAIADTQCGFKMFTRKAAQYVFARQRSDGFSFDVEILFLARKRGYRIVEVPVNWHNVEGSKINLVSDSICMLGELFRIRLNYLFGRYRH